MATPYAHQAQGGPPQGNGMAVASMVLGILAVVLCWIWFLGGILALLAIIFGAVGMSKAKKIGGRGKGAAVAGLVLGVIGIVLAVIIIIMAVIAVSAFESYAKKGKKSEADLMLNVMEKKIKSFHIEKARLPVSSELSLPGPDGAACQQGGKMRAVSQSKWSEDPGWREMGFHVDEDSYYTYHWTAESPRGGYGTAIGDLDCDGNLTTYRLDIEIIDGNPNATYREPTPD